MGFPKSIAKQIGWSGKGGAVLCGFPQEHSKQIGWSGIMLGFSKSIPTIFNRTELTDCSTSDSK